MLGRYLSILNIYIHALCIRTRIRVYWIHKTNTKVQKYILISQYFIPIYTFNQKDFTLGGVFLVLWILWIAKTWFDLVADQKTREKRLKKHAIGRQNVKIWLVILCKSWMECSNSNRPKSFLICCNRINQNVETPNQFNHTFFTFNHEYEYKVCYTK